ncbi:M15 family metallopeptidase [Synechococcus sp. M16CYN]|uniref:M15 family metallopeptidase n=1 Tax=Synechococcus sp. M16CYN TaxID=3103139 RepID=UPI00324B35E0
MVRLPSAQRIDQDEIPVARRTRRPQRQPKNKNGFGLLVSCLLVGGGSMAVVMFAPQFRVGLVLNEPLNTRSFHEPPDADGRLLGHFPYDEALDNQLITFQPGIKLHVDTATALNLMINAARAEGVDLRLLSGYRSQFLQESIFFDVASERNQTPEERAHVSAPPGYSEHSTGYAIDLGDGEAPETNLSVQFEQTRAFRWLQDHAALYHFVLSFPDNNSQGVMYEPWHWRYEGSTDALRLFEPARRFFRQRL